MHTILLAVDGTQKGLDMVSTMGQLFKNRKDIRIVLLHCVPHIASLLSEDLCMGVEKSYGLPRHTQETIAQTVLKTSSERLTASGFPEANVEHRLQFDSFDPAQDIMDQANRERIPTIAVGRRGRSRVETLLLGSVSSKVAQYAADKAVWVVDAPLNDSMKVLIATEGAPDVRNLSSYTAELFGPDPGFIYSFVHILPPLPPEFWDDGHILSSAEQEERQARIEKWRAKWTGTVDRYMSEGSNMLLEQGVDRRHVETRILPIKQGIARDLLAESQAHRFKIVVMGRTSSRERKPFLMGSHTSKVLEYSKGVIVCLVSQQ